LGAIFAAVLVVSFLVVPDIMQGLKKTSPDRFSTYAKPTTTSTSSTPTCTCSQGCCSVDSDCPDMSGYTKRCVPGPYFGCCVYAIGSSIPPGDDTGGDDDTSSPPGDDDTSSPPGDDTGGDDITGDDITDDSSSEYCGDGIVQFDLGEECDEGAANGLGQCDTSCKLLGGGGFIIDPCEAFGICDTDDTSFTDDTTNGFFTPKTSVTTCINLLSCSDALLKSLCEDCAKEGWPDTSEGGPLVIYDVRAKVKREDNHHSTIYFTWKTNKTSTSLVAYDQGVRLNKKELASTEEQMILNSSHRVILPHLPNANTYNIVAYSRTKDEKAHSDIFMVNTLEPYYSLWEMMTNTLKSSFK